jgi:hypothetical protein
MTLHHRLLLIALVIPALSAPAAFAKANFSGDWKLNTSKSQFGEMPPPQSMSQKISHNDPKLAVAVKMTGEMGEWEWQANYTTDGAESTNTFRDNPSKSVVKWDGDSLLFDTKGRFGDNDFTMKEKWTLSPDGKTLTMERHFSSSYGEGDQKLVMEKQ